MTLGSDLGMAAAALGVLGTGGIATWGRWLHNRGSSISGRWFAKHAAPFIAAELAPVIKEMTPNGGSSTVDRLARVEQWSKDFTAGAEGQFRDIKNHLSRQDRKMDRHLEAHAK